MIMKGLVEFSLSKMLLYGDNIISPQSVANNIKSTKKIVIFYRKCVSINKHK